MTWVVQPQKMIRFRIQLEEKANGTYSETGYKTQERSKVVRDAFYATGNIRGGTNSSLLNK